MRACVKIVLLLAMFVQGCANQSRVELPVRTADADHFVECHNGAVVSVSGPASDVGVAILKQGGNAVDAAIATAFAVQVCYPVAGNIGGGGFMLVRTPQGRTV